MPARVTPPPSSPHTPGLGRRLWLRRVAGAVGGGLMWILWPARRAWAKKVGIKLTQVAALQQVGGAQMLKIKGQDVLLVRDTPSSVRAINPMCTHKKCLVRYRDDTKNLHCKCHKSAFKLDGSVLGGPAKKDLATYPASLSQEQIVITLPDAG